jgi:hypothetical protein
LRRCVTACKYGSWSDALAEAECLEAETKGLREKIWIAAVDEAAGESRKSAARGAFTALRVAFLAMTMVLTMVIPISLDPEANSWGNPLSFESIALLTSEESDIISALRHSLSSGNRGRIVISVELPEEGPPPVEHSGAAMAADGAKPVARSVPVVVVERETEPETQKSVETQEARRPSIDEVISLIQVGQRALRSQEPGVRVAPR